MLDTPKIGRLRALVFDIDGTLYRQNRLRRAMLLRLLAAYAAHPIIGYQTLRILRAYRRAQEHLRGTTSSGIGAAQITRTCEVTNIDRDSVVECVSRWMEQEPLVLLRQCVQPGLLEFLQACKARNLRLGALSDYPAQAKLEALGLLDFFDVILCTQAPEIDALKPNPRGLLTALERLGVARSDTMYIGDRLDVDAPTAEAAGVRCAILTRRRTPNVPGSHLQVASYAELRDILGS